jgi:hypothetical protein
VAAYKVIDDYFKKIMMIRGPAVAAVINPRLRLHYFQRLLEDDSTTTGIYARIHQHFKNAYGSYKRRQKEVEEAKRVDSDDIYTIKEPVRQANLDPTLDEAVDLFYNFEDDRIFYDISEESRYLSKRLVPI